MKAPSLCLALLLAAPAAADPLPDMAGAWTGSGWVRQAPGAAQESVRCRLNNVHDAGRARLRVRGACAVPGRRLDVDGALIVEGGSVSGFWSNPAGAGQAGITGRIDGDAVRFAVRARDPATGRDVSQIVTLRSGDGLSMRSEHRDDGSPMSSIAFSR